MAASNARQCGVARLLAVLLLAAVTAGSMWMPAPAWANEPASRVADATRLISSAPDESEVLYLPPDQVVLRFDEAVRSSTARLTLVESSSVRTPLTDVGGSGPIVTAIVPISVAGPASVEWRVHTTNGRELTGTLTFTVNDIGGVGGFLVLHGLHLVGGGAMLTFAAFALRRYRRPAS